MDLNYQLACLSNKIDAIRDSLEDLRTDYLNADTGDLFQVPILALTAIVAEVEALRRVPQAQAAAPADLPFLDSVPDMIAAIANVTALAATNSETVPIPETIDFALMAIEFLTEFLKKGHR